MDIFTALSDPVRRQLIEALWQRGPLSIKQLGEGLQISRQAVTKHLDMLIKAKLVSARYAGKERIHELNPRPMEKVALWLQPFAEQWDDRLSRLKVYLGEQHEQD
ncbi:winged helix-turn-helix domain-containing protein [Bowmanella sp. Y26]|uniref:ArsR/SmtB family transcription factor n=1 Tax=Bowmanella yangjiangensis TaxID=2811230 RepID=UPI001BDDA02F|nr:metalloregulator ArsR/SmtB family transcription factor [Bowmanella yangjiangensis]MBT1063065.1 winged helix-turn-helix domain-containing protein [Bowmanella yangjiangensis]